MKEWSKRFVCKIFLTLRGASSKVTLSFKMHTHCKRYNGFQARSKDQEILEEGGGAGLRKLDFLCFELFKLFLNSSATDIVFVTAQAQQLKQQLPRAVHKSLGNGEGTPP